jgi:hypothetical protein
MKGVNRWTTWESSIETVLGYPPVEFVHLAADLGCRTISMKAHWVAWPPYGYGEFSFLDDTSLRRQMVRH